IVDATVTIKQVNSTLAATASAPDIPCGQTTGTITVTASNGTTPYSYSIDGGTTYQSPNTFSGLAAGNYTIKVKDFGGCIVDATVTIKQVNSTLAATASAPDIPCGQTTGTITVTASNGTTPYSYSIDGGTTYQSPNTFSGLAAGNYTIKVKDFGGCIVDATATIKQTNSTLAASASAPDIPCGQTTGTITVTASNGTTPYFYRIEGVSTDLSPNTFSGLAAGNYTIKVKDAGGCIVDATATIKQI